MIVALNSAGKKWGVNFLEFIAMEAYTDKKVALKVLDKLVPNLQSQEIKTESVVSFSIDDIIIILISPVPV